MQLDEYRYQVSKRLLTTYGIDWTDACGDDEPLLQAIANGESAKDFVDWFGRKYDLDPISLYGLSPPYQRIAALRRTTHGKLSG